MKRDAESWRDGESWIVGDTRRRDCAGILAALGMSVDEMRAVKQLAERRFPEIGYYGLKVKPDAIESNDYTEFAACYLWLARCEPWHTWADHNSYGLKHVVEKDAGFYVTNGAFILAAAQRGFEFAPASPGSPNAQFKMRHPKLVSGEGTWPLLGPKPEPVQPVQPVQKFARAPVSPRRAPQVRARGYISPKLRAHVMERDGFRCRRCGRGPHVVDLVVDHIIPVVLGGLTIDTNLQTLCRECNAGKAASPPHSHDLRGFD